MDHDSRVSPAVMSSVVPICLFASSRNLKANEQKSDWFLRLNPNGLNPKALIFCQRLSLVTNLGKIPVLVDNNQSPPYPIFETSAELVYLYTIYDKNREFGFTDPLEHTQALQWLFFWHGNAPTLQQWLYFAIRATEKVPRT